MTINVRLVNGKVKTFAMAEGWHVVRQDDDLEVRWHTERGLKTDRCHVFAPGYWREFWIE